MKFFFNGPDIPPELLQSQEEGRLVFFCGAGVSMAAGLPTFRGLVKDVRKRLGATFEGPEAVDFRLHAYDRVLGLLERKHRFGPAVRRAVVQRLAEQVDRNALGTHQALLALGTRPTGELQLVTTNFDTLFQDAGAIRTLDAPMLPVPKPGKWSGLVHLHGRILSGDDDGRSLVLTSADFGVAYLVEGWAARFVAELFQQFDVLFVGYGVNDPVMRYLVDAIAVERQSDPRLRLAYALMPGGRGADDEWRAKGIVPIPYSPSDNHAALQRTLQAWASRFNGGLDSRVAMVQELAAIDPEVAGEEGRDHFRWAMSHASGVPAQQLHRIGKTGRLEWVEVLEAEPPKGWSPGIGLVRNANWTAVPSPGEAAMCGWLAGHANSVELLSWVMERGGGLHSHFRWCLNNALRDATDIPIELRDAWRLVLEHKGPSTDESGHFDLAQRIRAEPWSPLLELSVLAAFRPTLDVSRRVMPWRRSDPDLLSERLSAILHVSCRIEAETSAADVIEALESHTEWRSIARDLLPRINAHLSTATDLLRATGQTGGGLDATSLARPSIGSHEQNSDPQGWLWIVELIERCLKEVRDPLTLAGVTAGWGRSSVALPRRLYLYSARVCGTPSATQVAERIVDDSEGWLWNPLLQVELFPLLGVLREQLPDSLAKRLRAAIEVGPPRQGDGTDEIHSVASEHDVWTRLTRYLRGHDGSSAHDSVVLDRLEAKHRDWTVTSLDAQGFLFWSESHWDSRASESASQFATLDDATLSTALASLGDDNAAIQAWREVVANDPARGVRHLPMLVGDPTTLKLATVTVQALRGAANSEEQRRDTLTALSRSDLADPGWRHAVSTLLREWAKEGGESASLVANNIARLAPAVLSDSFVDAADMLTAAVQTTAGALAEAAVDAIAARKLGTGEGLPSDLADVLRLFARDSGASARAARVILSSRLPLLHGLDPSWATADLIPRFAWTTEDEARACWQGYMWSPWTPPSLWRQLKSHAKATVEHLDQLNKGRVPFVQLIASISLDGKGLSPTETRAFLRALTVEDLAHVARWLRRRVAGDADDRRFWSLVKRWLGNVWPRDRARTHSSIAEPFAQMAIDARRRFSETVDVVLPYLVPNDGAYFVLTKALELGLAEAEPTHTLKLVDAIIPDNLLYGHERLGDVVARLTAAAPEIAESVQMRRLRRIATYRQ